MAAHARLSPSAAKIWMACPAMPSLAAKVEQTTSVYAEEGTLAHELAEICLTKNIPGISNTHLEFKGREIPEDMRSAVQVYLNYVRANIEEGDEYGYEQKLSLNDNIWGTADFVRYRPSTSHLLVADYKHGKGVFVDVENNPQALTYAVMAAKKLGNRGLDKVTLAIIQPRCEMEHGGVREWEIDAAQLVAWEAELLAAMERTLEPDPPFFAGPHCRWCPAAAICPALKEKAQDAAKADFSSPVYDPKALSASLNHIPIMEYWIKAVWEFAFSEAQQGRCPPGFKLVEKRPTRKWANEEKTAEFLLSYGLDEKDIYKKEIKSPPAIEKIIGKNNADLLAELITKESSGLTLADINDKREAVRSEATADFSPVVTTTD